MRNGRKPPLSLIETGSRRVDVLELFVIESALGLKPLALAERIYEADKAVDDGGLYGSPDTASS